MSAGTIATGDLFMDAERHLCRWKGTDLRLTASQFTILAEIARKPDTIKTREYLLDITVAGPKGSSIRAVDSQIKRLRQKFAAADPSFNHIGCDYSLGYLWRTSPPKLHARRKRPGPVPKALRDNGTGSRPAHVLSRPAQ